ncbi:hypothetical protein BAUCODRAFT_406828 [Baudoinia panamericana UAMH 10762]|uniref:Uncharacterized protein n=1 Tax=Baudoinia panamericana (strain UAMH 10762) TaxID=717646 RepID=M2N1T7_BAUPA|nr:uncharacterized protein BAUCODRAFT_406828 [Baudoinia panamericana UAMH 10762]EMC97888.1 hypothetical protein BAUCODRAFT_406828 [Baudoinia panamericana UAMH 10762]
MGPIFASPDIAALVAAFPPPQPTQQMPGLVLDLTGSGFRDSRRIHFQLRHLLETSPARIKLRELPSRLDVAKVDWMLSYYEDTLLASKDGQSLIGRQEASRILDELVARTAEHPVEIPKYLAETDMSLPSFTQIVDEYNDRSISDGGQDLPAKKLHVWPISETSGKPGSYIYSNLYAIRVGKVIKCQVTNDADQAFNLSDAFADTLPALLLDIARFCVANDHSHPGLQGTWQIVDGKVWYTVPSPEVDPKHESQVAEATKLETLVTELREHRFCVVATSLTAERSDIHDPQCNANQVKERAESESGGNLHLEPLPLNEQHRGTLLVEKQALQDSIRKLRHAMLPAMRRIVCNHSSRTNLRNQIEPKLLESETSDPLALLLLQTKVWYDLQEEVYQIGMSLRQTDQQLLATSLHTYLLAPLRLYQNGIRIVEDTTLQSHLEDYLGDHFRSEVVPATITHIQELDMLEKARKEKAVVQIRKMVSSKERTLSVLFDAATKCAASLDVPSPSNAEIQRIKHDTLRQRATILQKLSRGSDVLQHLVWILLAKEVRDALFMSAGRDTTRMIKLYQTLVGKQGQGNGNEVSANLGAWRDALKSGQDEPAMLAEVKALGAKAVAEVVGNVNGDMGQ